MEHNAHLERVVVNLMTNAIGAMERCKGGEEGQ